MTITSNLFIQPFKATDYEALSLFSNELNPDYSVTARELQSEDEHRDPKLDFARFVIKEGNNIIAAAEHRQFSFMYHPQKFYLEGGVLPKYQNNGLGTQLYEHLLKEIAQFDPTLIRLRTKEDRPAALHFIKKRNFVEEARDWESRLNLKDLNLEPYEGLLDKLASLDIEILSIAELMKRDENWKRKFYDLVGEIDKDVPIPEDEVATQPDFETWQKMSIDSPSFMPEASLIAVTKDAYVGFTEFRASEAEQGCLYNGLTGVTRNHRQKGLASALKVKNLGWAKKAGYNLVKTWNDSNNHAMLKINEALGFQKQPAWISYRKHLKS